jgi:Leucine-rich repeat (LRR) protein
MENNMNIQHLFNKITFYNILILFAITTSAYSSEMDHTLECGSCPYFPSMTSNGHTSSTLSLVEIDCTDLDNGKQLTVRPNQFYSLNLGGEALGKQNRTKLEGIAAFVFKLSLFEANLDNDILNLFPQFIHVAILDISNNYFDDQGMIHLHKFPNLVALTISNNKITHKAGSSLLQLSKLRSLDAGCTFLGDEGVKLISQLRGLEYLNIRACGLSEKVFLCLNSMPSLRKVVLSNNEFSSHTKDIFLRSLRSELQVIF